jgi:hypothetical protein
MLPRNPMVTHNANLVVNANADQIIVAQIGRYAADGLPPISYYGGGLEEEEVRKQVCDILEGGAPPARATPKCNLRGVGPLI